MTNERRPGDENPLDKVVDLAQGAKKFYENNEDLMNEIFATKQSVSMREDDLLREVHKEEDKVIITAETSLDFAGQVQTNYDKDAAELHMTLDGQDLHVKLPLDVIIEEAEGSIKNGVLTVEIPRDTEEE